MKCDVIIVKREDQEAANNVCQEPEFHPGVHQGASLRARAHLPVAGQRWPLHPPGGQPCGALCLW